MEKDWQKKHGRPRQLSKKNALWLFHPLPTTKEEVANPVVVPLNRKTYGAAKKAASIFGNSKLADEADGSDTEAGNQ